MEKDAERERFPFVVAVLVALALGAGVGSLAGVHASPLGELGALIIRLLKMLATPLVFFVVTEGFLSFEMEWKSGARLLGFCAFSSSVATAIAMGLSSLFPIHEWVDLERLRAFVPQSASGPDIAAQTKGLELSAIGFLKTLIPNHVFEPFLQNNVIGIVVLAAALGLTLRSLRATVPAVQTVERLIEAGVQIFTTVLSRVIPVVPIAVFGVVAKVVGEGGFRVFGALGLFVVVVTLGLAIHVLLYYPALLWVVARKSPISFFRAGRRALSTAIGTGSSLASLPMTLEALEKRLGVSPKNARLAACVGTNFNNDGIILYEAAAALFVATLTGIDLSVAQKVAVFAASVMAAMGIAGIPEAGLITLSLVLASVGLDVAIVPLLLPVDWFIGRLRATTNVCADMANAVLLDSFESRRDNRER